VISLLVALKEAYGVIEDDISRIQNAGVGKIVAEYDLERYEDIERESKVKRGEKGSVEGG
jgi:hypothetical protein